MLLYLACHGVPDPPRPRNVYLVTYDTEPEDISGTAMPMRDIDLAFQETLLAERIVIIADTCHGAAIRIVGDTIGPGNEAQLINAYLQAVSKAKGGVALLTSAGAKETAQEDEQWGGGHSVFTFLYYDGSISRSAPSQLAFSLMPAWCL